MPSMPGPSSCVKNCDATLRRVMLSPLLPAMAAVQYSLEKKQTDEALHPAIHKGLNSLFQPVCPCWVFCRPSLLPGLPRAVTWRL